MENKIENIHTSVISSENIKSLREILSINRGGLKPKYPEYLKNTSGLYAFWWIGKKQILMDGSLRLNLKGPNHHVNENFIPIEWSNSWFPENLKYWPLYVGKATNLSKRLGQHLLLDTPYLDQKDNNLLNRKTTACQLRSGIEHILGYTKIGNRDFLLDNVGYSQYPLNGKQNTALRFYAEEYLIGSLRPWFNVDSER